MHTHNGIETVASPLTVAGLTIHQEARLRIVLRKLAPSEPWVDEQFVEYRQIDQHGEEVVRRLHNPSAFPPGGAKTSMIRCPVCGVFTPPPALENGVCLDHASHANWGPSPSALTIHELQKRFRKLRVLKLRREDETALKRQIQRYEQNKNNPKPRRRKKRRDRWISIESTLADR